MEAQGHPGNRVRPGLYTILFPDTICSVISMTVLSQQHPLLVGPLYRKQNPFSFRGKTSSRLSCGFSCLRRERPFHPLLHTCQMTFAVIPRIQQSCFYLCFYVFNVPSSWNAPFLMIDTHFSVSLIFCSCVSIA